MCVNTVNTAPHVNVNTAPSVNTLTHVIHRDEETERKHRQLTQSHLGLIAVAIHSFYIELGSGRPLAGRA